MEVEVKVTEEDIVEGKPLFCSKCPIAKAVTRLLRKPYYAIVGGGSISIVSDSDEEKKNKMFYYGVGNNFDKHHPIDIRANSKVWSFVRQFDSYGQGYVQPFSFNLDIPEGFLA